MGLCSRLDASTKIRINTTEHLVSSLANTLIGAAQVTRDVTDEVLLLAGGTTKDLPQTVSLDVVLGSHRVLLGDDSTGPLLVFLARFDGLVGEGTESRGVVRVGSIVAVDIHVAIAV